MSGQRSGNKCEPGYRPIYSFNSFMINRWREAVHTLAKLHKVVPSEHGLSNFGKHNGFYNRQIKTLSTVSAAQARVVDVDSKTAVGKIPHFDDMVSFFRNPATQPDDRACVIHGDYKIDNLVFHNTEPRVIGILE